MQEEPELVERPNLEDVLGEASSRRAWLLRWLALGATLIIAVVLSVQLLGPRLTSLLAAPTIMGQTAQSFELASNATWATFTVRGQPMNAGVPFTVKPAGGNGPVTVSVYAPPFSSRHCFISVPIIKNATCSLIFQGNGRYLIAFRFDLHDLPPDLQTSVMAQVNDALSQTQPNAIIIPGAHYALGDLLSAPVIAQQPLLATLSTIHAPDGIIPDSTCATLCAPDDLALWTPAATPVWHVQMYVLQQWRFKGEINGVVVGKVNESLVPHDLHFDLVDAVTFPSDDEPGITLGQAVTQPLCKDGFLFVQSLFFVPSSGLSGFAPVPHFNDRGLDGCLIQLAANNGGAPAIFFWRTGTLYTANILAQQAEPTLPRATKQDLIPFGQP